MSDFEIRFSHDLYPGDLICLEFLTEAVAQDGDASYGDSTVVGDFSYATNGLTSAMITSAQAFWTTGVIDSGTATVIGGFSESTPREYFDGYISDSGGGTGAWQYALVSSGMSKITGLNFAMGVRGWYAASGYDTTVSAIYSWLMASTSNSTYETADGTGNQALYLAQTGTYDPNVALSTYIDVLSGSTAVNKNGSSLYDWGTYGVLSKIQSSRNMSAFKDAKSLVSTYRRRAYSGASGDAQRFDKPSLRGKSGLGYQMAFTETVEGGTRRVYDTVRAAMMGLGYREAPFIYTMTDNV